jgi:hypothetical protein
MKSPGLNAGHVALIGALVLANAIPGHQASAALLEAAPEASTVPGTTLQKEAARLALEAMLESDQAIRKRLSSAPQAEHARLWAEQKDIDAANLRRLDEIVSQRGWPKLSEVGSAAVRAAFLIVQHAPLSEMKRYYPLIRQSMLEGETPKSQFAFVEDRIRLHENRPQLYGSQMRQVNRGGEVGQIEIWMIEDEVNVDKRRAEMGLEPLAEAVKRFGIVYVPVADRPASKEKEKP